MQSRFSPFVLNALVDTITGGAPQNYGTPEPIGVYRTGPEIEKFFLSANISMSLNGASRMPATHAALQSASIGYNGHEAIARVITTVCDPRGYLGKPEKAAAVRQHLNEALEADGFKVEIVNGKAMLVERQAAGVIISHIVTKASTWNFDTVENEIARALANLSNDPEDAVTAASSLLEAVCRSILVELGLDLPQKKDMDGLWRAVQQPLGLSPGQTGLPPLIEHDVRQILSGLTSVVWGTGALRTHAGDAHGREKGHRRLPEGIARFAINAAGTAALFIIETWERGHSRALPFHPEPA